ncbi:MAG: hypothetical protein AB1757_31195 [Acidobacteriota bacterium]
MRNKIITSTLLIIFAITSAICANAQTAKRIQFAKGKSSATIQGNTGSYGATYVVRARAGQKMTLNLTPTQKVGIKVETTGADGHQILLREARGGRYEIYLEEGGDFTMFIGSTNNQPVPFTLTVKITRMADI